MGEKDLLLRYLIIKKYLSTTAFLVEYEIAAATR
jgi:hypothetical protein